MDQITLYIPRRLNDGTRVSSSKREDYESELLGIAETATLEAGYGEPGVTMTKGTGLWISPSRAVHRDRVWLYALIVADSAVVRDAVLGLASRIRVELMQEAVFVVFAPIDDADGVTEYVAA